VHEVLPLLGNLGVKGLLVAPPSLEELFLRHYGDTVTPTAEAADDGEAHHRRHRAAARTGA
jgi:ABC-2 type transport system ATP-binding protein